MIKQLSQAQLEQVGGGYAPLPTTLNTKTPIYYSSTKFSVVKAPSPAYPVIKAPVAYAWLR